MRRLGTILVLSLLAAVGCDDNTPFCVPATTASCFCATGEPGEQACKVDGLSYGTCTCLPDAGVPGEAEHL